MAVDMDKLYDQWAAMEPLNERQASQQRRHK
jgi:hypothetical protein